MKVHTVAGTLANWKLLLRLSTDVVGRSMSRTLDAEGVDLGDTYTYIAALGELEEQNTSSRYALSQASFQLHHISVSFMVEITEKERNRIGTLEGLVSTLFEGKELYDGTTIDLLLITGTLAQWQHIVPKMLKSRDTNFTQVARRLLFNQIYERFKMMNLELLFSNWQQTTISDGTFCLEQR